MSDERNPADASRTVTVANPDGLHLRPITAVSKRAATFQSAVTLSKGDTTADATAMIQLLSLAAGCGDEVTVRATGPDAAEAVAAIADLVAAAHD